MNQTDALIDFLRQTIENTEFSGQVFIAGGFVRDRVMGRTSKDIDLVVVLPDGGIRFAKWICDRIGKLSETNPIIFPRFGTAKFNLRGIVHNGIDISEIDIESVMTRSETYTNGSRKPDVVFASLKDDVMRRDFTVNSLVLDITSGNILDLTEHGFQDIHTGIIRTSMDAEYIFREDPLRMLRAIRFAVRFDWDIAIDTFEGIYKSRESIRHISMERIRDELSAMLLSKHPSTAIRFMFDAGLLNIILPEVTALMDISQNEFHEDDVYTHTLKVLDSTEPVLIQRLSALFHDIAKPITRSVDENGHVHFYDHEEIGANLARNILTRLRYPSMVTDSVSNIILNHMRLKQGGPDGSNISDKALRKFQSALREDIDDAIMVMHADNLAHHPDHQMPQQMLILGQRISSLNRINPKIILPINGHDVMKELGITSGPMVKHALDKVKEAWFENPNLTREQAIQLIK